MHREFVEIDIEEVTLKETIRDDAGDLSMLATSVSRLGLLTPILIDRNNIVITGARRLAACRQAGIRQLPAIRLDTTYDSVTALEIQVDMNLCLQPLTNAEVEKLIGKKRLAARKADAGARKGILTRIKQLFE
jgi:hypothetical protein